MAFIIKQLRDDCSKRSVTVRGVPQGLNPQGLLQGLRAQQKNPSTWLVMFHNEEQARFFITTGSQNFGGFVLQFTACRGSDIPDDWLQNDTDYQVRPKMPVHRGYIMNRNQNLPGQPAIPLSSAIQGQQHVPNNKPHLHGRRSPNTPTTRRVPFGDSLQVVPTDLISAEHSLEPTVYMNYPNVSYPELKSNALKSNDNKDFTAQVPTSSPMKKYLTFHDVKTASGQDDSHRIDIVQKRSNAASMRLPEQEEPSPEETRSIQLYTRTPARKVNMGDRPQVVLTDPVPSKASHEPTVYMNSPSYPSRSNPEPQVNAPPPYESHDFTPQFHPRLSTKNSSVFPNVMAASGPGQPHTMDSVYKSSDSASMSTNEKEEPSPDETRSIKVSLLPDISVNEEFITDFFENKKNGGGDVAEVDYDQRKNTAIVTFEDSKVVKSVLERHEFSPLKMNKVEIQIEEFYPQSDESDGEIEVSAILVTNLPPNVTDQQIELFFENSKKSGGREVQKVEYDKEARSAIVTFKDAEVVPKVLQKHETSHLMINKQKVDIEEYRPPQDESGESSEEEHEEAGAIKVTKLPPGTTEEAITLFFENRKKSGGWDVEKVEYDEANHSAVVWFTEAEAVSHVLQKVPLLFNKKQIHVEEVGLDGQKVEKEEEDSQGPLCTIEVRGMKDTTSKDSVEFYFENKRSGGGNVEEVKGEVEDGVLLVTFVDEKTVERVLQRTHKVDGVTLQVKRHEPKPIYKNKVFVKGLNPKTTKEGIVNYLEAKTGDEVLNVAFGRKKATALVTFKELTDFSKLERSCQKRPLENHYLSVKTVPISNCVCVSGFSKNTSERTLEYYFDNTKKSGGKDVTDVKFNHEDNTCLVYFEDHTVCDIVCKRSHVVDNQNLTVQIYHDCLGHKYTMNTDDSY